MKLMKVLVNNNYGILSEVLVFLCEEMSLADFMSCLERYPKMLSVREESIADFCKFASNGDKKVYHINKEDQFFINGTIYGMRVNDEDDE